MYLFFQKSTQVIKEDPDHMGLPYDLLQTSIISLVKPQEKRSAPRSYPNHMKKPKNFKKFKKVCSF